MTFAHTPRWNSLVRRVHSTRRAALRMLPELTTFGVVGLIAFVVDVGGYNVLRATVMPDSVVWAKVVSVTVATAVAFAGHRWLTFRSRAGAGVARELPLFILANAGGLGVSALCLFISHYVLGFTSTLADNIAGNVVGLALGTVFRYVVYRFVVFRSTRKVTA